MTDMAKDIQAIDCWLNEFEDSLSKIKDKPAFLRYSVIAFIHNTRLLDIKYK
jgi:hypothetical protein